VTGADAPVTGRRIFTVAEANAAIPKLAGRFSLIVQMRGRLEALYASLASAGATPDDLARDDDDDGALAALGPEVVRDAAIFRGLAEAINDELVAIGREGVQVKDVELGLCDWPAMHHGRVVLLCWKLGEPAVGFFHEVEAGVAGRRPIAELEAEPAA
jgi:hypothetical protein